MKRFLLLTLALVAAAGCDLLTSDQKKQVNEAVLEYAETDGRRAVENYVDQCVAEGKFTEAQGEKIKAALPQGLEKLRETMDEIEAEQAAKNAAETEQKEN